VTVQSVKTGFLARARTDALDRLIEAEEPLADLHRRCGGELPGTVAIPELLALVQKARTMGLRLGRTIQALDGEEIVRAWVEVAPDGEGGNEGCTIALASWQSSPVPPEDEAEAAARRIAIDRHLAELSARLDPRQALLTVDAEAADLRQALAAMRGGLGRPWTDFVELEGSAHRQPLHWRLLDGARCRIPGSARNWTATLVPLGAPEPGSAGFELLLVADCPFDGSHHQPAASAPPPAAPVLGRELAPVLRQPIARIIANAETIRSRLAGPLADEYSNYAADIAAAGQHLLALIDDLADLEVVEADDFTTAADRIDLGDVVRRAAGILGVRAQERGIAIDTPGASDVLLAIGEFRRVLQILLNLIGNAINYSPEGSRVSVTLEREGDRALVHVTDQGEGLAPGQQAAVFEKFERLGRSGDGGSGLGLYISRRLARAMDGDLSVTSNPGEGARFTLALPGFDDRRQTPR
jgi:hypothetical protein